MYTQAEDAYLNAIRMYIRLEETNPGTDELELADIYENLGEMYIDILKYRKAITAYSKALEIYIQLELSEVDSYVDEIERITQLLSICKQESHTETRRSVGDRFMRLLKLGKYKKKK
jgi:tetratricopeptide (TPR) repeat protein